MADQEIIKHGKKLHTIYKDPEHGFFSKVKEFIVEVFIIVFAVSLSIWLHNWNEHRHEQDRVKKGLLTLKQDIRKDIDQTKNLIESYHQYDTMYTFLSKLKKNSINGDSIKMYLPLLPSNIYMRPNRIRFESFLSSGNIANIENDSLALSILEYYQLHLPQVSSSENGWKTRNSELNDYLLATVTDMNDDSEIVKVLASPKGRYFTRVLIPWPQIYERYEKLIQSGEGIIKQIDQQYPD